MAFPASPAAFVAVLALVSVVGVHAQYYYPYGAYGYGLRTSAFYPYGAYGAYGAYPVTYGYSYPYLYGRRLLDAPVGSGGLAPTDVDSSACPLTLSEGSQLATELDALVESCRDIDVASAETPEFCAACVTPGQSALGAAAYEFVRAKAEQYGNGTAAFKSSIAPLLSADGEASCGKLVVDYLVERLNVDGRFLDKTTQCGKRFDDRALCILDADEEAQLTDVAAACQSSVDSVSSANTTGYCATCYWSLLATTLHAALRDDGADASSPSELQCALQGVQDIDPAAPVTDEVLAAEKRLADAMFTDAGFLACAQNSLSYVFNAVGVEPLADPRVRDVAGTCWKGENLPDIGILDEAQRGTIAALAC